MEKSKEVERINLDGVNNLKIELAVRQVILLACRRCCAGHREKLHGARHPMFEPIVLLAFFTYVVLAKLR